MTHHEFHENTRLGCISYTDAYSVGRKSMNDFRISYEHKIFAAGMKKLKSFREGNYVFICANDRRTRWTFLAKITECIYNPLRDGKLWEYNFLIEPVTDIIEITPQSPSRIAIDNCMKECGLNTNLLFNSRFCSQKLLHGVSYMLDTLQLAI